MPPYPSAATENVFREVTMSGWTSDYPVRVEADYPPQSSRGLALCGMILIFPKVFLLLPHIILLYFINLVGALLVYIGFWVVFFTGKYPRGMYDFVLGMLRWQTRVSAWMYGLVDVYPPFNFR
jgi:hypothetical protein